MQQPRIYEVVEQIITDCAEHAKKAHEAEDPTLALAYEVFAQQLSVMIDASARHLADVQRRDLAN